MESRHKGCLNYRLIGFMSINNIVGQENIIRHCRNVINNLTNKKGSVTGISGETGMGKSILLNALYQEYDTKPQCKTVLVENQAPIGNFKISNIQPLLPFNRAIQHLMVKASGSAGKRFAVNFGLTALSSIPIIGDVFYFVKETSKDVRQYKGEKETKVIHEVSDTVADYFNSLYSLSMKSPLLLFFDNMHWADRQSVELLNYLNEKISDLPIAVIFTYQKSIVEANPSQFLIYMTEQKELGRLQTFELESFTVSDIRDICKSTLNSYTPNAHFEDWLMSKSYGVPGIITEYLKHFSKNSPFNSSGQLKDNFENSAVFPESFNMAFSQSISDLNEDERNLLALCSAEGREFTALIISHLLNTDVLTTIKRLRALQNKTSIIKSQGAHHRYAQTTTIYEFSQAFYHTYFASTLEYEEKVSIHAQIAKFLKTKMDESSDIEYKGEIAPYIAAHSLESGDEDTAKKMLLISAQAANETGGTEAVEEAYAMYQSLTSKSKDDALSSDKLIFDNLLEHSYLNLASDQLNQGPGSINENDNLPIDFNYIRRSIVDEYHKGNLDKASDIALTYLNTHKTHLQPSEQAQMLTIAAKCFFENNDLHEAEKYCHEALELIKNYKEPIPEAFALNISAIIKAEKGDLEGAYTTLQAAARKSVNLPAEIRLLTISNIALLLKKGEDKKSDKYLSAVRKISKHLNFDEFAQDVIHN